MIVTPLLVPALPSAITIKVGELIAVAAVPVFLVASTTMTCGGLALCEGRSSDVDSENIGPVGAVGVPAVSPATAAPLSLVVAAR